LFKWFSLIFALFFEVHINRVKPASFFGPTTLATPSYTIIALTFAQQGVDKSNTTKPF
jgi:hypothetical protein